MTPINVLIVDDNMWWAASLQRTLQPRGFTFVHVPHGLAAIDEVDRHRPDVVLLDIFLPGPNGLALVHELRSHDDLATLPVVILSGAVSLDMTTALKKYGIQQVLDKGSTTPEQIAAALRKALL